MLSDYLQTVDWSRAQFAMTAIYHWLFVPLTLGLGFILAIMETLYVRTGDDHFLKVSFPVVSRATFAPAGCRFLHPYRFRMLFFFGGFRFATGQWRIIRLVLPLGGYALRDKFFHEILVYLRHPAALLCHIIVI